MKSRFVRIICALSLVAALVPLPLMGVAVAATEPTSFTSSVPTGTWTSETAIDVSWDGADDGGTPVDGYSFEWSEGTITTPDETIDSPLDGEVISAGDEHTVAVKADGSVVATGTNTYPGECNVSGWSGIEQVAAGSGYTIALKADASVVATGYNLHGQCNVSGWSGIEQVGAGNGHTVALKADGSVVATGSNTAKCDVSDWADVVQISAGHAYTAALKADGSVVATGSNTFGQCDVSDWADVVQISAGTGHTVALKADGSVVA
ncbi:MAG: hypothetical protein PF636_06170, partial [Actinomycetota bacterium]|nr:hypothetical protein [Actinomycetota bacterium]